MNRRELLWGSTLVTGATMVAGWGAANASGRARLLGFIPSDEKSRTVEKQLASAFRGVELTVLGRAKDLQRSVARLKPEAVIAPLPTLRDLGLTPTLTGRRGSSTSEPYTLVTVDRPLSPKAMGAHTVGILGIMGHSAMKRHCGELLGTSGQRIKTVTKYADLLPLLQFGVAKGVILPERFVSTLTSKSALKLVKNHLPQGQVGLTSIAIQDQAAKGRVVSALNSLDSRSKKLLGVEAWK